MYLFYDDSGEVYRINYSKPTIKQLEKEQYIEYEGDIPSRDGYHTNIFIDGDEVKFNFIKMPQIKILKYIEEIEDKNQKLETVNKANMLAIMEVHKRINSL